MGVIFEKVKNIVVKEENADKQVNEFVICYFVVDPPVMCRPNFTKMVYNDLNATAEDTTICLPKVDTLSGDICHNPSEPIVYQYEGIAFTEQENATHFCLTYKGDPVPIVCVSVQFL